MGNEEEKAHLPTWRRRACSCHGIGDPQGAEEREDEENKDDERMEEMEEKKLQLEEKEAPLLLEVDEEEDGGAKALQGKRGNGR